MADCKSCSPDTSRIKEAICIDTDRVYDSCADKDCLTDLRVYLTDKGQCIVDRATTVRCRSAEIINCFINVEKVPFNKGFYTVDLVFFVKVALDAYSSATCPPTIIEGLCTFGKKCILYGSEGNIKVFSSEFSQDCDNTGELPDNTNPKAKVQCVDPICLDASICRICDCCNTLGESEISVPSCVCRYFDGNFNCQHPEKAVKVTLGIFTIIQLERDVQMLIPAYDFCVPTKECCCDTEDPCDAFRRIKFPIDEFFPPNKECLGDTTPTVSGGCGCGK